MSVGLLRKRKRIDAEIDLTPLIDVVFQLLIFLLVSSQFTKPEAILDLPKTPKSARMLLTNDEKITISLQKDGLLFLNQEKVEQSELGEKLAELRRKSEETPVEIRCDREGQVGRFVEVIEVVKEAGFDNIGIVKKISAE